MREICGGLACCEGQLKYLGAPVAPKRSTLACANEHRPWQLYQMAFERTLRKCRELEGPLFRSLNCGCQTRIWVNGLPPPPQPFRPQLEDRKMQVWRARVRISSRSGKTDDVPTLDPHSPTQPFHVPVQVRVVVAIHSHFGELVHRICRPVCRGTACGRSRIPPHAPVSLSAAECRSPHADVRCELLRTYPAHSRGRVRGWAASSREWKRSRQQRETLGTARQCKGRASKPFLQDDRCAPSNHVR